MSRLLTLIILLTTTGCASMINGRYQPVEVSSSPSGAAVAVSCGNVPREQGVTPARIVLRRGVRDCSIQLTREGYRVATFAFTRAVSGQVWANVLPALGFGLAAGIAAAFDDLWSGDGDSGDGAFLGGTGVVGGVTYAIDRSTGAMYKQVPGRAAITLDPLP